jgi:hypothetical protein
MELNVDLVIAFTDEALAQMPQLRHAKLRLDLLPGLPALSAVQRGDVVRFEGLPSEPGFAVVARSWTVMRDQVRLMLVLRLAD